MLLQLAVATALPTLIGAPHLPQSPLATQDPREDARVEIGSTGALQDPSSSAGDLSEVIAGQGLERFSAAIEAAGLRDLLRGEGPLTVGDSRIVATDTRATNGVVHSIDRFLIPTGPFSLLPTNATQLIELAIERGVPQFNDGNLEACAAIYETAVVGLLQRETLPTAARAALAAGYRQAATEEPGASAWTLRRALDRAYAAFGGSGTVAKPDAAAPPIFDFESVPQARLWGSLNDTVMGGRSDSRMEPGAEGWARFAGDLSLENNGGFASVRAAVEREALEGTTGVELRVRGDGRTYRFLVSTSRRAGIGSYDIEFSTSPGQWQVVKLPFQDMRLNIMGRRPAAPPPSADSIASVGLLVGDKKPGPFALDLDWIRPYR